MNNKTLTINKETAMRLWNKAFGKCNKAVDFAGREMDKAAYDDRNSKFGWNIDHILPQSRGGKTTESNLLCCHILTNDEKADKFPCFTANEKRFEIIKVQNHYEIKNSEQKAQDDFVDFLDSAAGVSYYKQLQGIQNKKTFVGIVVIRLSGITTTAIIDFISKIFTGKMISFFWDDSDFAIQISEYNMPHKEDTAKLLDDCVLLNTYLGQYFVPNNIIDDYQIFYGVHHYSDKLDCLTLSNDYRGNSRHHFIINDLVRINTEAEKKLKNNFAIGEDDSKNLVYEYDCIFTNLAENLKKQN